MSSLFTKILNREIPGYFIWEDDICFAILTIAPLKPGHTLVIPKKQVDDWIDLDPATLQHLFLVSQKVASGLKRAFSPEKVALMIVGLEVRHVHIHLSPINSIQDTNFANQKKDTTPEQLSAAAKQLRSALRELGFEHVTQ
jgi:diadenosine tetraphosphate (Ap4A) HIT family hydrolase